MADPRWLRVRDLAGEALDLPARERAAFVARACGDDEELRREVAELLAHARDDDDLFLESPPVPEHARLGEFEVLRKLGRGATAAVYLAWQPSLQRRVALKVLEETGATPPAQVERFHREARAVAKLHHPGLVQVYADGREGRTHWFAMELVEGHDLARELDLQRRPLDRGARAFLPGRGESGRFAAIARVCAEVAEALHHAHEHGVVHRDVKPQNLLLSPDGRVQVADFGLARDEALGDLTKSHEIAGTLYYMSPEQARVVGARVDRRTDVYSLGVVLYEMCALQRPIEGATSLEIVRRIQEWTPRPLRKLEPLVPRDLETICTVAMAKDRSHRYATAADLARDLRAFLAHDPIEARPPGPLERAGAWARRNRGWLSAAGLAVAGIALGSVGAAARGRESALARVRDAALARVTVVASTPDGAPASGTASFVRLDPETGVPLEDISLGPLPVREAALDPGFGRVVVHVDGRAPRVLVRDLEGSATTEVRADLGAREPSTEGMVRVAGGVLALHDGELNPQSVFEDRALPIRSFWLDASEVSNAQYRRFLEETDHAPPPEWDRIEPGVHDDLPVVKVSWQDAVAYAEWLGKRLPSYAEWTWAARGAEGRLYPWADADPEVMRGNVLGPLAKAETQLEGVALYLENARPVAPEQDDAATPEGLHHMFGNVSEWTETPHAYMADDGRIVMHADRRFAAGFCWDAGLPGRRQSLATHEFFLIDNSHKAFSLGFRCALDAVE